MKVLVNSYLNFAQNTAGGVYSKVHNFIKSSQHFPEYIIKPFDIWKDKIRDYDIVHYFALKTEFYDQMILAKKLGKKVVISSIVTIGDDKRTRIKIRLGKAFRLYTNENKCKDMLSLADAIITETQKEKDFIVSAYNVVPSKIYVIPNGVSEEILNGDASLIKAKLGIDRSFILQVGRFDTNKNQLSVIRALAGTDIPVVFVGGPDSTAPEYYEKCRKEAGSNCFFTGWINHDDPLMASAYEAAKVVVLPSHHEIFGNAIFEGAMTKSNIVATNVLPLDEFGFSNSAIAINPDDIDDIRSALMKAYEKDIDEHFAEYVKQKYSLDAIFKEHIEVYNRI